MAQSGRREEECASVAEDLRAALGKMKSEKVAACGEGRRHEQAELCRPSGSPVTTRTSSEMKGLLMPMMMMSPMMMMMAVIVATEDTRVPHIFDLHGMV